MILMQVELRSRGGGIILFYRAITSVCANCDLRTVCRACMIQVGSLWQQLYSEFGADASEAVATAV